MPPQVEFHTGVADELQFTCRLLRKAYHKGARVVVRAAADRLARLDRELWTAVERDFVPHLRLANGATVTEQARRTPIWLVDGPLPDGAPGVLVNLGAGMPEPVDRFERIIEIVGHDVDDAERGRQRWRAYRSLGLEVKHHGAEAGHG